MESTKVVTTKEIIRKLRKQRIAIYNEKQVQQDIFKFLQTVYKKEHFIQREYRLDSKNIIDILFDVIGIEVKLAGSPKDIYYQCERYCQFEAVGQLILITTKVMRLPSMINNKLCFVYNLSEAWL